MPLQRVPDWPDRLHRMIESAAEVPFQLGTFDCCLHVCNCIRTMTVGAPDLAANYRGKYSDEAGAAQIYGASLEAFIANFAAELGCPEVPVTFARRGDVVFVDNGTPQGAIGVVSTDGRFASCASDKGLALVRLHRWKRAWRIGA
jgi:hypothetical protein